MQVMLVPSSVAGGDLRNQYLTSVLIDETVAIDAGSLGFFASPEAQARVRHVVITHTHIDHIASLPILVENAYEVGPHCVTIHASEVVLDCLRRDMFNDRVWPDFLRLSRDNPDSPFLKLATIESGRPLVLDGLTVTPVAVHHLVPTLGVLVDDGHSAILVPSDTGPTEAIWQVARDCPRLQAVFLEAAFPNAMQDLAAVSGHLTPAMFGREVAKLGPRPEVRWIAVHIKPRFRDQILAELRALDLPNLEIAEPGATYTF